jgi:putative hydrolase of the HAD superfamily
MARYLVVGDNHGDNESLERVLDDARQFRGFTPPERGRRAMTYDAVVLDLDDTLYPYPPCNEAGKAAAFERARELGYDWSRAEFDDAYAAGRRDVKRELSGTASTHERVLYLKRAVELQTGESRSGDALALGEAYWDGYVAAMELFDGVTEALRELRDAGVSLAVATNLTTRVQLRKLDALGVDEHVDVVVTSEEVGREKPGSVMFTLPMSRLGVTPDETVVVGDSVRSDVEGGNAVGATTVLANSDASGLAGHRAPDHRIESFPEITRVVL